MLPRLNPHSSTTLLVNFIQHEQVQRMQPLSLLRVGGFLSLLPDTRGCWRAKVCSPVAAIAEVKACQTQSRKVCPLFLPLSLCLSLTLPPSHGGVTAEDRPPRVRQAATRRERMARRAPTGICGTVQSATSQRALRSSPLMNNGLGEKASALKTKSSYLSYTHPQAAELQIDEQWSLNGGWG